MLQYIIYILFGAFAVMYLLIKKFDVILGGLEDSSDSGVASSPKSNVAISSRASHLRMHACMSACIESEFFSTKPSAV